MKGPFYVRGFNPPVMVVKDHPDWKDAVWVVPQALPWASARLVRRDQLRGSLRAEVAPRLDCSVCSGKTSTAPQLKGVCPRCGRWVG